MPIAENAIPAAQKGKPRNRKDREKSGPRTNPLKTFTYWIVAPAMLVYVAICALVILSLSLMTSEINSIDGDRGKKAIAAAVNSFTGQLEESVADEATWTEAYINTYVQYDPAWLDGAWGSSARSEVNYDTAIVTSAEDRILFGESSHGPLTGKVTEHFSGATELLRTLDAAIAQNGDDTSVARFSRTADGLSGLAAAVIHGSAGQMTVPLEDRRVLLIGKRIDDELLQEIAHRFEIPIPHLADAPAAGEDAFPLTDAAGNVIGQLVWRPLRPGDIAFQHAATVASLALLVIGMLVFAALVAFRRSVERRAESDERDWVNARYDQRTGLINSYGLEESITRLVPRRGGESEVAVAQIEFEGVRDIIGSYGQDTAEFLLDALADRIDAGIEGQAMLARVGPYTFALCRTGDEAGALVRRFARVVVEILSDPIAVDDLSLKLGATIGIAVAPCDRDSIDEPSRMAAAALQYARETGGNHIIEYDASLEANRQHRLALQADIRRGIDADEFDIEYQPIFNFSSQSMYGVEALLRWNRRRGGPLSPSEFIPAAEASGLIEELGLFALRRACRDMARYPTLKLSVNVSTVQLRNPKLPAQIDDILASADFPVDRLQLEITESFLLAQPERAKAAIEQLRSRGIVIALDDFGTGFSSIGYLRQFQFDRVKLDRSLVDEIDMDPVKAALVESTMVLAFAMGLAVTAEGVERHEEARTLTRLGCREFQGYLFSRPLPLEALGRLLGEEQQQPKARKAKVRAKAA